MGLTMGLFDKLFKGESPKPAKLLSNYAYAQWSCIEEDCPICQALDGTAWITGAEFLEPPLSSCQTKDSFGCSCSAIYVSEAESGSEETAEFIRKLGGIASPTQMSEYSESVERDSRIIAQADNLPREKGNNAYRIEKTDPDRAITLFRESVSLQVANISRTNDLWKWRDIGSHYNRLTLLLERSKQYSEALSELSNYEALNCDTLVNKSDAESLQKRRVRLSGKSNQQ